MKIENPSQQFLPRVHHKLAAFSDEVHEAEFQGSIKQIIGAFTD